MEQRRRLSEPQMRALIDHANRPAPPRLTSAPARHLPSGAFVELYGPPQSGKSTAVLRFAAGVQRAGGLVALLDSDARYEAGYAAALGVDCEALAVSRPADTEQMLSTAQTLLRSGLFALVAVDSVEGVGPREHDDDDSLSAAERREALQVRLIARGCARLQRLARHSDTTVVFTHPVTELPGAELAPGASGRVLRFYASLALDVRQILTNGWSLPVQSDS